MCDKLEGHWLEKSIEMRKKLEGHCFRKVGAYLKPAGEQASRSHFREQVNVFRCQGCGILAENVGEDFPYIIGTRREAKKCFSNSQPKFQEWIQSLFVAEFEDESELSECST